MSGYSNGTAEVLQSSGSSDDSRGEGVHSSSISTPAKGLAISSLPSRGLMRTRRVPRATIRPRERVDSLPSSSVFVC